MPQTYEYKKLNWYPHMGPADVVLWERFISQFPDAYDTVQYDVKIGTVPEFVAEHEDEAMRAQAPLYQRKIDVIGYKADQIDIIEVKPRGGLSAIGQVDGYRDIYMRDFSPPVMPKAILITDRTDVDTQHSAYAKDVQIVVV